MGDERFVIMSIFFAQKRQTAGFHGKALRPRSPRRTEKGEKKETQRIPSLFFSKLPDESKTIQCKPSVRTCFELGTLDLVDEGGEAFLVEDGHVGKDLAVETDAGLLEAVHEHGVGHAVGASAGIDTGDPQTAERTLLVTAVTIGILTGAHDSLLGNTVDVVAAEAEALGKGENFLMTGTSRHTTLNSGHLLYLL